MFANPLQGGSAQDTDVEPSTVMPASIQATIYAKTFGRIERELPGLPCVIGRAAASDVVIDDPSVSSRHALLSLDSARRLVVTDLGSTNGIVVNGEKIGRAVLELPAEIRMGTVSLVLSGSSDGLAELQASGAAGGEISVAAESGCYYRRAGHEVGPFSWAQLKALARKGVLRRRDVVWTDKEDNWLRADLVPGLFDDGRDEPPAPSAEAAPPAGEAAAAPPAPTGKRVSRGDLVCPHCWHKFDVEDFLFIARHQDLTGDSVLGPEAQQRFLPSKFTPEGHAIDSAGLSCPDMACPRCHLRIPRAASEMPPLFASIVGAPATGKSYFLTAMVWQMRNILTRHFAITFTDTDAITNQIINDFEEELFLNSNPDELVALRKTELQGELYSQVTLDGMVVHLLKPFMFSLTPAEHHPDYAHVRERVSRTFVLYDNAGEHFEPGMDSVDNPTTQHLMYSDTIFFLFDPTKDVRFRERLHGNPDPQLAKGARVQRQEVLLTEMINRIEKYSGKKRRSKSAKTLIILVPKADLWMHLLGYELPAEPWRWDPAYRTCALDVDAIMSTSFSVRALLAELCPEVVATAEAFSNDVLFLPNSALGRSPILHEETGMLGVRPRDIHPFWITVPMLYMFHRHGLMPVLRPELMPARELDPVEGTVSGDLVFVSMPGREEPLAVPVSYCGYRLRCPGSGRWFRLDRPPARG
ncbi:MAG: Glycogen accumulation regulator GarA [Lentisphaerae bacterium ADurb.BinA184]|nr:MAG: Glycogen accumulation regulator GarA [Lentisphaerae bacterium ADurb.BinA184]